METTLLEFCEYAENDYCIVTDFEVPTDWLKNQISESLDDFLNEYTSDDAVPLYELAILEGKILSEHTQG